VSMFGDGRVVVYFFSCFEVIGRTFFSCHMGFRPPRTNIEFAVLCPRWRPLESYARAVGLPGYRSAGEAFNWGSLTRSFSRNLLHESRGRAVQASNKVFFPSLFSSVRSTIVGVKVVAPGRYLVCEHTLKLAIVNAALAPPRSRRAAECRLVGRTADPLLKLKAISNSRRLTGARLLRKRS